MIRLTIDQFRTLRDWFDADRLGDNPALHVLNTGHGEAYADRWPDPRAALAVAGDGRSLRGVPAAVDPQDLRAHPGFYETPATFDRVLLAADPDASLWHRVYFELQPEEFTPVTAPGIRRLGPGDAAAIGSLSRESAWISGSWDGPEGLAASGVAWGAFDGPRLVSVACSFEVGNRYEDIGVVTEAGYRGRGLAAACASSLCEEVFQRGQFPSWSTGRDNEASVRVAEKLGFRFIRPGYLYVVGTSIPDPATPP